MIKDRVVLLHSGRYAAYAVTSTKMSYLFCLFHFTPRTDDLYDLYDLYDLFPLQFMI